MACILYLHGGIRMKKSLLVCVMFVAVILGGCSSKNLEGEWEEITSYGKGDKFVITKSEITVENQVLKYKISEDKKHLILSKGQNEKSITYQLDKNKLMMDDDIYYRVGSKEYKEQEKKTEK